MDNDLQNFSSATCLVGILPDQNVNLAKMKYMLIGLVNLAEIRS